ncbi:hypothetical protein ACPOLB_12585 [Rubrivivax sp. RP6-9]|uniref:hypothetical protein n=1 Tax=Rubrivivax sp. RP6-9 TaxID=3415750 RepID=UPI003CC6B9D6
MPTMVGAVLAGLVLPAVACPLAGAVLQAGAVQAAWRVAGGAAIAVGRHFTVEVQLCPAGAALARVDATMPEHRHGMNYRPSLHPLGDGRWRADGLMFHMAGRWELRLDVAHGGRTETLRTAITLP